MRQKINTYEPVGNHPEWPRVASPVRVTVAASEPQTSQKISELMSALTRLALFVEAENTRRAEEAEQARKAHEAKQGARLSNAARPGQASKRGKPNPAEWLSIDTIDRFIRYGLPGATTGTRDSYRRRLMRLRTSVIGGKDGKRLKLSDTTVHRPYSWAEQKEMWSWAHNQPTRPREAACKVLLCLGLGCGLESAEITQVRVHDVRVVGTGAVVVHVRGPRQRAVKCRRAWEPHLAELVANLSAQATWLFQPNVERRNTSLVSNLVSRARKAPDAPPVRASRLRATWLTDLIDSRVALDVIASVAGLDSLDALSPLMPFIARTDAAEAERQLRGLEP
ncbi:tyrosine-type recombinase/integrase [Actinomadura sp. KC06]|uniref:tyrosine-type recombinase/integrase n=1 Tax=Actinomadura sp. KC06 TaxID=2530369 RepID=UPI001404339D|nr:tyrosine-type recombinase/integrase [Actinomadura sp. KC06]